MTDSQVFIELSIIYANQQLSYFTASVTVQAFEYVSSCFIFLGRIQRTHAENSFRWM